MRRLQCKNDSAPAFASRVTDIPSAMKEISYKELPMLEVISLNRDPGIAGNCRRRHQAGFGCDA
jgi:hypothetical protein